MEGARGTRGEPQHSATGLVLQRGAHSLRNDKKIQSTSHSLRLSFIQIFIHEMNMGLYLTAPSIVTDRDVMSHRHIRTSLFIGM